MASRRKHRGFERLESRDLLTVAFQFTESPWSRTFGDVDQLTVVGDFDGDGRDDFVGQSVEGAIHWPKKVPVNAWYRLDPSTNRLELGGPLPNRTESGDYSAEAAVDIDSDGDLDLVVSRLQVSSIGDGYEDIAWLENTDSRGTFTTEHAIGGIGSMSTYLADFDEDGDFDLSYWASFQGQMTYDGWFRNDSGSFTAMELNRFDFFTFRYDVDLDGHRQVPRTRRNVHGLMTADLDGDGQRDELERSGTWTSLDAANQMTFNRLPGRASEWQTLYDDIDFDSDVDVWVQEGHSLKWLENDGFASFTEHAIDRTINGSLSLAQLDSDPQLELVELDPQSHELFWYDYDHNLSQLGVHTGSAPSGETPQATIDFNRDGRVDVVGTAAWYEATAVPGIWVTHAYPSDFRAERVLPADINGDRFVDLIFYSDTAVNLQNQRALRWAPQRADGTFAAIREIDLVVPTDFNDYTTRADWQLFADDLDGDGDADLAVLIKHKFLQNETGLLSWFANTDGSGDFEKRGLFTTATGITSIVGCTDVNGDRQKDLFFSTQTEMRLLVRAADGSAQFTDFGTGTGNGVVADLDRDGDLDLLYRVGNAVVWTRNVDGTGIFQQVPAPLISLKDIESVHAGDFDADGDLDVVVGQNLFPANPYNVDAWPLPPLWNYHFFENVDGSGQFQPNGKPINGRGEIRAVVDLTADGKAEILATSYQTPGIVLMTNITTPPLGDFNSDGLADVRDLDILGVALLTSSSERILDLTDDGTVDRADYEFLVNQVLRIPRGDANGDGVFNSADLIQASSKGGYENREVRALWSRGDWNGDGYFDSSDLVRAMQESVYQAELPLFAAALASDGPNFDEQDGPWFAGHA